MTDQAWILIIGSIFTGLTTLLNLVFVLLERQRNHIQQIKAQSYREKLAADLEVARKSSDEAARHAEELKKTVIHSKETRELQIKELGNTITQAIAVNTTMNEKALDAANGVNAKIQTLGLELAEKKGADRMADHMEAKTVTIETKNVEIHPATPTA